MTVLLGTGCSGRSGSEGSAPGALPSGIAPAPPRAHGPGAAKMTRPTSTAAADTEEDDPLFPVPPGTPTAPAAPPGTTEL